MRTIFGRLRGVSPALDGAFIEARPIQVPRERRDFKRDPLATVPRGQVHAGDLLEVVRFGGMPVEAQSMFVSIVNIEELAPIPGPDELETGNSYGRFIESDQWVDDTGVLSVSVYENCVHLNLRRGVLVDDTVVWKHSDPAGPDVLSCLLTEINDYQTMGREVVDFLFRMRELKKGRE